MKRRISWPDAPRVDNAIYSDAYIEHWGERYTTGGFVYRGVSFMQFLARPTAYVHSTAIPEPLPLLGSQQRVRTQLILQERRARREQPHRDGEPLDLAWITKKAEQGIAHLPRRAGRIVEPLHHHRHPRNSLADFTARQEHQR